MNKDSYPIGLLPDNPHDQRLRGHVAPVGWQNPKPAKSYNLVVIGAGTAGLVSAVGAASLGARVAIVERNATGGDCLNYGCVPSKALIRGATAANAVASAARFGTGGAERQADFTQVMDRMRKLRADIAPIDSVDRLASLGVDVFLGEGSFAGSDRLVVAGQELHFSRAIIATGARAKVPAIPGLTETPYYTNETIFSLTERPAHLAIVGTGPIGCELAQAFRRLGSEVTMITNLPEILAGDDASKIVRDRLTAEGVRIWLSTEIQKFESNAGKPVVRFTQKGKPEQVEADALLLAMGRTPNTEGLQLDLAKIRYNEAGVLIDDRLQTTNSRVFAAGDICSRFKFTHAADALARIALQNALFYGRKKASDLVIPWSVFTDPEIAHVGINDLAAKQNGAATYTVHFEHVDRAIIDGDTEGFGRVHVEPKTGQILGATIVGKHAGDIIGELVLAMTAKVPLGQIAETVLPYPTRGEVTKKLGDAYNRDRLTPRVKAVFQRFFSFTR